MKALLNISDALGGRVWFLPEPVSGLHPHCHEELEFNLVVSGRARYLLGQRCYELRKGSLVWLFPNQQHVLLDQSADFQMWVAVFKPLVVQAFCPEGTDAGILREADPLGDFARVIPEPEQVSLGCLCRELETFAEEPELYRSGLAWLLRIAWRRWRLASAESRFEEIHPAVEKAIRLLHADHTLTLSVLAARSGLSASRLSRIFKAEVGYTVSSFRNHCRIQTFLELYGVGKRRNMLDCALESGFGSYEQFHRTFKQQIGCSPSRHKRKSLSQQRF